MPKPEAGKTIDFALANLLSFTKVGNAVTFPEGSMMEYYDELKKTGQRCGMTSEILKNTVAFSDTMLRQFSNGAKKIIMRKQGVQKSIR
jgi:hypothetical protein